MCQRVFVLVILGAITGGVLVASAAAPPPSQDAAIRVLRQQHFNTLRKTWAAIRTDKEDWVKSARIRLPLDQRLNPVVLDWSASLTVLRGVHLAELAIAADKSQRGAAYRNYFGNLQICRQILDEYEKASREALKGRFPQLPMRKEEATEQSTESLMIAVARLEAQAEQLRDERGPAGKGAWPVTVQTRLKAWRVELSKVADQAMPNLTRRLLDAELSLADGPSERRAAWARYIKNAKRIEQFLAENFDRGWYPEGEIVARLDAELHLLREKGTPRSSEDEARVRRLLKESRASLRKWYNTRLAQGVDRLTIESSWSLLQAELAETNRVDDRRAAYRRHLDVIRLIERKPSPFAPPAEREAAVVHRLETEIRQALAFGGGKETPRVKTLWKQRRAALDRMWQRMLARLKDVNPQTVAWLLSVRRERLAFDLEVIRDHKAREYACRWHRNNMMAFEPFVREWVDSFSERSELFRARAARAQAEIGLRQAQAAVDRRVPPSARALLEERREALRKRFAAYQFNGGLYFSLFEHRKLLEDFLAAGRMEDSLVCPWDVSRWLLQDDLALAQTPAERKAAKRRHVDRLKAFEIVAGGEEEALGITALAKAARLEAEALLHGASENPAAKLPPAARALLVEQRKILQTALRQGEEDLRLGKLSVELWSYLSQQLLTAELALAGTSNEQKAVHKRHLDNLQKGESILNEKLKESGPNKDLFLGSQSWLKASRLEAEIGLARATGQEKKVLPAVEALLAERRNQVNERQKQPRLPAILRVGPELSRLLLEAELAASTTPAKRLTAWQKHFDAMKALETYLRKAVEKAGPSIGELLVRAACLEAELWVLQPPESNQRLLRP